MKREPLVQIVLSAVLGVAHNRVPAVGQVHPDLVLSTGQKPDLQ